MTFKRYKKLPIESEMKGRTLLERAQAVFEFLEKKEKVIKADFKDIGLVGEQVDNWIGLIQYIQSQKKLVDFSIGRSKGYELESD